MGISEATLYNWKKFGGLGTSELRRPRQLEEENSQLKKLVTDLSLDKHVLQEVFKKSFKAAQRRAAVAVVLPALRFPTSRSINPKTVCYQHG